MALIDVRRVVEGGDVAGRVLHGRIGPTGWVVRTGFIKGGWWRQLTPAFRQGSREWDRCRGGDSGWAVATWTIALFNRSGDTGSSKGFVSKHGMRSGRSRPSRRSHPPSNPQLIGAMVPKWLQANCPTNANVQHKRRRSSHHCPPLVNPAPLEDIAEARSTRARLGI